MSEDLKFSEYDFTKIPFDKIVSFGQRTMLYRDTFTVSWLLGRYCNYNCSYCWPYARSDTKDHRPTGLVIKTIDEIKRQARDNGFNSFHFSFSGGEPTLHPGFLEILSHYSSDMENCNNQTTHITSNISRGMRWFEKYVTATKDLNRVSVTASWHREHGIKKGDIEGHKISFADKLVYLQEHDVQVTINMVMVPDMFEELWGEAVYFHERGINVTLKPQSDPTASVIVSGYTDDQMNRLHNGMPQRDFTGIKAKVKHPTGNNMYAVAKARGADLSVPLSMQVEFKDEDGTVWYMDQAERFNAFGFNKFTGWKCNAGYQSIIIREPDGSIKRSYSCHDQPLGNIATGFNLFPGPKECITPSCVSSADSKIPKYKL